MSRLILFILCSLFTSTVSGKPPNVLFIAVDDLRPELGVYGSRAKTPNIDRLAASGLRFDRAYTAQAVCGPSRLAVMTGLYPDFTGERSTAVSEWRDRHPDVVTLNQFFKQNGYNTVGVGKIYHQYTAGPNLDLANWTTWFDSEGCQYYTDPASVELGKRQAKAFGVEFKRGPTTEASVSENAEEMYHDGHRARVAIEQVGRLTKENRPFFLAVGFSKPHLPFSAPRQFWDLYDRESFKMPENLGVPEGYPDYARNAKPGEIQNYSDVPPGGDPKDFPQEMNQRLIHGYHACVSYMDWNVGRVLDELKRSGAADNTIVVLWGDHGWKLGDHNSWCKHTVFEVDTRVPLVIVDPRSTTARGSTTALVELIDLYPTLAEMCGLQPPPHLQGRSIVPVLEDPTRPFRKYAYSSFPWRPDDDVIAHSIRSERYRYTEWWDAKTDVCLARVASDLSKDPGETRNVLPGNEALFESFVTDLKAIVIAARPAKKSEPTASPSAP